jgi:hypothetical protein
MPTIQELVGARVRELRKPHFKTPLGAAYCGIAEQLLPALPDESVSLIFTSPPYALHFKKDYGNMDQDKYVDWFLGFASEFRRVLKPYGSLVINTALRNGPPAIKSPTSSPNKAVPFPPTS